MRSRYTTPSRLPFVPLPLAVQITVGTIVLQPQMIQLVQLGQTPPIAARAQRFR
jgi:hypothetical protein